VEIDLKADIKKYEAEEIAFQGQLVHAQQKVQILSNHAVMRQGIIAYLRALDGQEQGRKQLQAILDQPEPPAPSAPEPDPPPAV